MGQLLASPLGDYRQDCARLDALDGWQARRKLVDIYAHAIPNELAIQTLVRHCPIVEIGAGRGYWAKLISEAGGDIVAFDAKPPKIAGINKYHPSAGLFFPVKTGFASKARAYSARTLFLCWPGDEFADDCLRLYQGATVIYIGEAEGMTADECFDARLASDWKCIDEVSIPTWLGLTDVLRVYSRARAVS